MFVCLGEGEAGGNVMCILLPSQSASVKIEKDPYVMYPLKNSTIHS